MLFLYFAMMYGPLALKSKEINIHSFYRCNSSSKLQRNLKEIYKKGNNSAKKQFFKNLRKPFLDSHMRNVVPKFQSSRLNGVATIALTYIDTYIDTYIQTSCRT